MKSFHKLKIYGIGKVGPKGQVVIPADARKELGMNPGERVVVLNIPHEQGVMIVGEGDFNRQFEQFKDHFGSFNGLMDEYKEYLKDDIDNA